MKKKKGGFILHGGKAFESMGSGKFAKDVLRVGVYHHPATGQIVEITPERIDKLSKNTMKYIEAKNEVFFPDGHTTEAAKNLGDWPGPFFKHGDALMAVCQPKAKRAIEGLSDNSMNRVSAMIEFDVTDPKGNHYDEVITHVCATPMPVITGQKDFVKLSSDQDEAGGPPVFVPKEEESVPDPGTGKTDELSVALALDRLAQDERDREDRVAEALQNLAKPKASFED